MTSSREKFTVQVLRNGSAVPAGVGFVVDETHVVTCAHVVNTALGRKQRAQGRPDPMARVQVTFPILGGGNGAQTLSCIVQAWAPPPASGVSGGDVAGLVVAGDELPELAGAAWLADSGEFRGAEARKTEAMVFGYPGDPPRPNGAWAVVRLRGAVGGGMIHLDAASESAFLVQPGYSGSPVIVTNADGDDMAVGMLAAAGDGGARDAYAIPVAELARAWPEVVGHLTSRACPYRGLEAFTADDADVFFGREDDIARLHEMVRRRALTMVTGPSGVGKSSLVNAGLIPRLQAEGWSVGAFRPGGMPVDALARTLASVEAPGRPPTVEVMEAWTARIRSIGLSGAGARLALALGQPVVLHTDQLEEILDPQVCVPDGRAEFLELLLSAHAAADEGLHLVGTVRADFLAQLLEHPDAGTRLAGGWFGLSPMSTDRLKRVITEPARARGVSYQGGLAAVIAEDAGGGRALPLLEFALTRLWPHMRGREISLGAYHRIGGVAGALSGHAEDAYRELLGRFPQERIRRVLLALVRVRGGAADATRRVASRDRLGADWEIAQALARHRLVTIGRDDSGSETAEIVHEALIREWPTLAGWVDNDSDFQRWLSMAEERAADGELLPGTRLADADGWLADRAEDIPPEVRQLIRDSKSEWHRRITELEDARNRAEARRLALAAELALTTRRTSLQIPIILAIEALKTAPVVEADIAIRHAIRTAARPIIRVDHGTPVGLVMFSPDGARIATASGDDDEGDDDHWSGRDVRLFDAATGAEIWHLNLDRPVRAMAFSPDGTRIATGSGPWVDEKVGEVRLINAATGARIWRLDHDMPVHAMAFSPDGTQVATGSGDLFDGSAQVVDVATGAEVWRLDHHADVNTVAFSPDGTRIATADWQHNVRLIDAIAGAEVWRLASRWQVRAVMFSPDGTRIAAAIGAPFGSRGGSAQMVDAATGAEVWRLDHHDYVYSVVFSPDGTRVAAAIGRGVGERVGSAWLLDAATGAEVWRLDHDRLVRAVVFSPDGTRVVTASGSEAASGRESFGGVRLIDAATGAGIWRLDHHMSVHAVAFSPDGTRVAAASGRGGNTRVGSAWLLDAATGAEVWRLDHDMPVHSVAFSPDGTQVATAGRAASKVGIGCARLIDVATGAEVWRLDHHNDVYAVAFSPDGTRIATASGRLLGNVGSVRLLDAATGAEIWHLDYDMPVRAVAFSPDGTRVATASHSVDPQAGSARVSYADHTLLIEQALGRLTRNLTRQEWSSYFHGEPYRKTRADLP